MQTKWDMLVGRLTWKGYMAKTALEGQESCLKEDNTDLLDI